MRTSLVVVAVAAGLTLAATLAAPALGGAPPLTRPIYGVTVDDVRGLTPVRASLAQLPYAPTMRVYLDVAEPAGYYGPSLRALHSIGPIMAELLDSSGERKIDLPAYRRRVHTFVRNYGDLVDPWEVGNEANGSWTGSYTDVRAKIVAAYNIVSASHGKTALTLYENAGCGDGPAELSPIAFSRRYIPVPVRNGLDYVFLSYYEQDCDGIRPTAAEWTSTFRALHALYPNALVGFGEVGLNDRATLRTAAQAKSIMLYYYSLRIPLPYYVGGYFWRYYAEACVPWRTRPLWRTLAAAFRGERVALTHWAPAR